MAHEQEDTILNDLPEGFVVNFPDGRHVLSVDIDGTTRKWTCLLIKRSGQYRDQMTIIGQACGDLSSKQPLPLKKPYTTTQISKEIRIYPRSVKREHQNSEMINQSRTEMMDLLYRAAGFVELAHREGYCLYKDREVHKTLFADCPARLQLARVLMRKYGVYCLFYLTKEQIEDAIEYLSDLIEREPESRFEWINIEIDLLGMIKQTCHSE